MGGLTVLKEIISRLPAEDIIYLGDTARVPYGTKPKSTVIEDAREEARFLRDKGGQAWAVAGNTTCPQAMGALREADNRHT